MNPYKIILLSLLISFSFSKSINFLSSEDLVSSQRSINFNHDWSFKFETSQEFINIDIPHDYSISQKFDEHFEAESGFLPGGNAIYQKKFTVGGGDKPSKIFLTFYGVYKDSFIYVNRKYLGENHYGYNTFSFDISDFVVQDNKTENILEVRVKHELFSSRWYSGSGIFRGVEMNIMNDIYIDLDGVKITTPEIRSGKGKVEVESEIVNPFQKEEKFLMKIIINDKNNKEVASYISRNPKEIAGGETKKFTSELNVEFPELWTDVNPALYTLSVEIIKDNVSVDILTQKFGFRFYDFNKERGFALNGVPTKLNGVSIHHDLGPLGSIESRDGWYKRFVQMQDMGLNTIRTTHNIASKIWLDLADELGIIVIEEIFDGWKFSKNGNGNDFGKYFLQEIKADNKIIGGKPGMKWSDFAIRTAVKRDRNHASIIMYSLGNELKEGSTIDNTYPQIARDLMNAAKELDSTRPFTLGDNECKNDHPNRWSHETSKAINDAGGIIGYNYASLKALEKGTKEWGSIYQSESASSVNSRGVYSVHGNQEHDKKFHLTSYDTSRVGWGYTAHQSLWFTLAHDFVGGQYVWTGYDYIGEPTPWNGLNPGSKTGQGPIPNSAYFGIIDTANFPKDSYYLYRAQLNRKSTTVHIVSAWDIRNMAFKNRHKNLTFVDVYTNAFKVELFRDDKSTPICTMNRENTITPAGYLYYQYTQVSNDPICAFYSVSDGESNDPGASLYNQFHIEFKEGTKLYTKAYNEDGSVIDPANIVGNHWMAAPHLDKLKLDVKCDKETLKANGASLAYIEVNVIDDVGILDTKADNLITFKLEGEGKILGVDNGDQATVDKFQQKSVLINDKLANIKVYAGKALVVVGSTRKAGEINLVVSSDNLGEKKVVIKTVSE